jgi:hypothetical protein
MAGPSFEPGRPTGRIGLHVGPSPDELAALLLPKRGSDWKPRLFAARTPIG